MKIKHPVFQSGNSPESKWYAIVGGTFYYWSASGSMWRRSRNHPGQNERRWQRATDEGRVYMVQLRGWLST